MHLSMCQLPKDVSKSICTLFAPPTPKLLRVRKVDLRAIKGYKKQAIELCYLCKEARPCPTHKLIQHLCVEN